MSEEKFKAGAGCAPITFPEGYFPTREFHGLRGELMTRVLLLERGGVRCALVVMELPSIRPWELTDELRAFAARELGIDRDNLWLVMTHDLSAPHVPADPEKRRLHMEGLRASVSEASRRALGSLREASVSFAEGTQRISVNRDMRSVDGWWVGIHGDGPSDGRLSLIRFDGADESPIAVLFSCAIKSSVMEAAVMSDGGRWATGDVTGAACEMAQARLCCPVIFVMGAAGDQTPRIKADYLDLDENGRFFRVELRERGWEELSSLGAELAEDIVSAAASASRREADPILLTGKTAVTVAGKRSYPKNLPPPPVLSYEYEPEGPERLEIEAIRIGDCALLGVKPEVTTPVFGELSGNSPFGHTLLATLVNGGQGYIATDTDYRRFTYPALNTPLAPGADRHFIYAALALLRDLYEKIPENQKY